MGLANGILEIHDIDKQDEKSTKVCASSVADLFHNDEITSIQWCIYRVNTPLKTVLVTGSKDGKMLVWDMAARLKYPVRGYLLSVEKTKEQGNQVLISCRPKTFFSKISSQLD